MANKPKFTKTEFRRAIDGSGGHKGVIAGKLGVSRTTVYNYLERYPELQTLLQREAASGRDEIVELAQTRLMEGLMDQEDIARVDRLVMFALRHYDKDGVPGAVDLGSMFSPDVVAYMQKQGIAVSDVVKEFEAIMRAQAEKVS